MDKIMTCYERDYVVESLAHTLVNHICQNRRENDPLVELQVFIRYVIDFYKDRKNMTLATHDEVENLGKEFAKETRCSRGHFMLPNKNGILTCPYCEETEKELKCKSK